MVKNVIQFYYTHSIRSYIAAKFAARRKGVGVVFLPSKSSMHFTTPLTEYKSDLDTCPSIAMFQITFEKERKWKWINRERIKPLYTWKPPANGRQAISRRRVPTKLGTPTNVSKFCYARFQNSVTNYVRMDLVKSCSIFTKLQNWFLVNKYTKLATLISKQKLLYRGT